MFCKSCKKEITDESMFCPFCGRKQNKTIEKGRKQGRRKKGTGVITRCNDDRSKKWRARYTNSFGKMVHLGHFASEEEAEKAIDKAVKLSLGSTLNASLEDIYNDYKNTKKYQGLSQDTKNSYRAAFNKLKPLHNKVFRKITAREVQDLVDTFTVGKSSMNDVRTLLGLLYNRAQFHKISDEDLSKVIYFGTDKKSKKKHILTEKEIKDLIKNDTMDYVDVLLCFVYTGARPSELLLMETKNVHLKENCMVGGIKTDAGKDRILIIHPKIKKYIKKWYNPKNKYLFFRLDNGQPISTQYWQRQIFDKIVETLGLNEELTPYSTRHTFATLADKFKVSDTIINKTIGHTDTEFRRKTYTHPEVKQIYKEISKIE